MVQNYHILSGIQKKKLHKCGFFVQKLKQCHLFFDTQTIIFNNPFLNSNLAMQTPQNLELFQTRPQRTLSQNIAMQK